MAKFPEPRVGDVWQDTDPRMDGRRVIVTEVPVYKNSGSYPCALAERYWGGQKRGSKVKLACHRLAAGQGWRLIERGGQPFTGKEV